MDIVLRKDSEQNDLKRYFEAILKLSEAEEEFPVDLDEVWMLVYSERGKAVRALKQNFIEGDDYTSFAQNGKREIGGTKKIVYKLSVRCMEYFVARKVSFNKLAQAGGYLEIKTRKSRKREKQFYAISNKGLTYGENLVSDHNPNETQPHWYDDRFSDLLKVIGVGTQQNLFR